MKQTKKKNQSKITCWALMMWHGFPLNLGAISVEFNQDFMVCRIPKLEWVVLLEMIDTFMCLRWPKGHSGEVEWWEFWGRPTMCCWRCLCWEVPDNAPARRWGMRNGDPALADTGFYSVTICIFIHINMYMYIAIIYICYNMYIAIIYI